jgi:hypothetical protein
MFEPRTELAPLSEAFSQQGLAQMSSGVQRQTRRDIERIQSHMLSAAVHEEGRAYVTNIALLSVGSLTALEQLLVTAAPLGEARYKMIVDGFAVGSANKLARL